MKEYIIKRLDGTSFIIVLGEWINSGGNSNIFQCQNYDNKNNKDYIVKCPKNNNNYVSSNLQKLSYNIFYEMCDCKITTPKVVDYGKNPVLGEVLLLEKMKNIYKIDFIINQGLCYPEEIISLTGRALARLHKCGISGFDVEFYWQADVNRLVILDIGPPFTFNVSSQTMINEHCSIEKNNPMGIWNLMSQILPSEQAKFLYKTDIAFNVTKSKLLSHIRNDSVDSHCTQVAKVNALTIIGSLKSINRLRYMDIFIKAYKKEIKDIKISDIRYLNSFEEAIIKSLKVSKVNLYYSKSDVLCCESSQSCIT